jgi:hypothetical protein
VRHLLAACAAAVVLTTACAAASAETFRLATGKTSVELLNVEVQRVTSDHTIDLVAVLSPKPAPKSSDDALVQLAEFCLRYKDDVVALSVPAAERKTMNMLVPLYQAGNLQTGFAFQLRDGKCALDAPFPKALATKARQAAKAALD